VVWPTGAHFYVKSVSGAKAQGKGSFAVSGKSAAKASGIIDYFNISKNCKLLIARKQQLQRLHLL
jgi:hypothetical protein